MNKKYSLFLLPLLTTLLSGCSTPTIHKPSFHKYGKLTDESTFNGKMQLLAETIGPKFLSNGNLTAGSDYKASCISSGQIPAYSSGILTSLRYYQNSILMLIDNDNFRATAEIKSKVFLEGNIKDEDSNNLSNRKTTVTTNKYYYEQISNAIACADITNHTFYQNSFSSYYSDSPRFGVLVLSNYYSGINLYELLYNITKTSSTGYSYYYAAEARYYINSNILTVVFNYNSSSINVNGINQIRYGNKEFVVKQKYCYTIDKQKSSTYYTDFSVKKTKLSISDLNYSSYTPQNSSFISY